MKIATVKTPAGPRAEPHAAFIDRTQAGAFLAQHLTKYANRTDGLVLGLQRGGVPVAAEVARVLKLSFDVFAFRKLRFPVGEAIFGAVGSAGLRVIDQDTCDDHLIEKKTIEALIQAESRALEQDEKSFRDDRPPPKIKGKTVILVDDGVASGTTMSLAAQLLSQLHPAQIVLAAPIIGESVYSDLHQIADDIAAVIVPEDVFGGIQWYRTLPKITDQEIRRLIISTIPRS